MASVTLRCPDGGCCAPPLRLDPRSLLSCLHNSEDLLVRRTKRAGRVNGENRQTVFTAAGELLVQLTCVKARTKES